jgi:hypothetical protein
MMDMSKVDGVSDVMNFRLRKRRANGPEQDAEVRCV